MQGTKLSTVMLRVSFLFGVAVKQPLRFCLVTPLRIWQALARQGHRFSALGHRRNFHHFISERVDFKVLQFR